MHNISTEIGSIAEVVGDKKAIELVAKAGFDCFDFTLSCYLKYDYKNKKPIVIDHPMNTHKYKRYFKGLRKYAKSLGITCNQTHTPFPLFDKTCLEFQKKAIYISHLLGAKVAVIHPNNYFSAEENKEIFMPLVKYAKKLGIKIATENMWDWDLKKDIVKSSACSNHIDFKKHLDLVNDSFFGACVDVGHAEMKGLNTSASTMISYLKDKVIALHIHDTDCVHDNHQIPFTMKIDYKPILKALKDINYQGDFTLESCYYISSHKEKSVEECVKLMANAATKIREEFLKL